VCHGYRTRREFSDSQIEDARVLEFFLNRPSLADATVDEHH